MPVTIDYARARKVLARALENKEQPPAEMKPLLSRVILGDHKTYRYILVTNLLAKAVLRRANALSLQSGAPIRGAFNGRTLCHKVVVPFEREHLANALGGSNEPYLNKPARYTHLTKDNAVQDGDARETLETMLKIARMVNAGGSELARKCLSACFALLEKTIANNQLLSTVKTIMTPDLIDIYAYITRFVKESFEGETCVAVVGAVEKQFYSCLKGEYRVEVHKVNESGASSKEVGDIDVYEDDKCFYSIEVKDKAFTVYDVEHAFNKMIAAHVKRGSFVYGPRATFRDDERIKITLYSFEKKKFVTLFMGVLPYVRLVLFQTPNVERSNFLQLLLDTISEMSGRPCTVRRVHEIAAEMFGKAEPSEQ